MAKATISALLAAATAWKYECEVTRADSTSVARFDRTNGRKAVRETRRLTKSYGPNYHASVVLVVTSTRGATKRKTIHQCHTDARGRLSPRGEEV
jgi:hypothetical protein